MALAATRRLHRAVIKILNRKSTYDLLDRYAGGTWTAGGCWPLAEALKQWSSGSLFVIAWRLADGTLAAQHVVTQLPNGTLIDAGGAYADEEAAVRGYVKVVEPGHAAHDMRIASVSDTDLYSSGITCPAQLVTALRDLFERELGAVERWM